MLNYAFSHFIDFSDGTNMYVVHKYNIADYLINYLILKAK